MLNPCFHVVLARFLGLRGVRPLDFGRKSSRQRLLGHLEGETEAEERLNSKWDAGKRAPGWRFRAL